ncbi:MAG TPA: hypothetical protein VGB07_08285 [Blastocatellia bacterium]
MTKPDKLISAQQAAEMTGLNVKTVLAGRAGTKEFTRVKVGKRRVAFSLNEVQAWIDRLIAQAREGRQSQAAKRPKPVKRRSLISQEDVRRIIAPFQKG